MSEISLHIPCEIRSKKNSKRIFTNPHSRRKIVIPSEGYEKWRVDAQKWAVMSIDRSVFPLDEPCSVCAVIYYKGNRPDLSGALESIGDVFEGLLWKNDKHIMSWDGSRLWKDNAFPRIELKVRW
jgi:hypothetical protein